MNDHLVPELVPVNCGITEIKNLPEPNKFALINGHNEFAIADLQKKGKVKTEVIVPNFPKSGLDGGECEGLYSNAEGTILWTIQVRAILGVNTLTEKTFDPLFAFGGNTSLVNTMMLDSKNEIILGRVLDLDGENDESKKYLISYDCKNDSLGKPGKPFKGYPFYIGNNEFLWCETFGSMDKVQWHICDVNLENIRHNKLTDELTKKQITVWGATTPISPKKRIMIGGIEVNNEMTYFSIRWNPDMSEAKIEPLLLQIPQNGGLEHGWYFSEDGSWLTATFTTFFQEKKQTIVFFHISDIYPQGISMPVFGEETYYLKDGCFLNHSELGPLYLDRSPLNENVLNVYKLNDVLKVLAGSAGIK